MTDWSTAKGLIDWCEPNDGDINWLGIEEKYKYVGVGRYHHNAVTLRMFCFDIFFDSTWTNLAYMLVSACLYLMHKDEPHAGTLFYPFLVCVFMVRLLLPSSFLVLASSLPSFLPHTPAHHPRLPFWIFKDWCHQFLVPCHTAACRSEE
jgi:hypothetical protein